MRAATSMACINRHSSSRRLDQPGQGQDNVGSPQLDLAVDDVAGERHARLVLADGAHHVTPLLFDQGDARHLPGEDLLGAGLGDVDERREPRLPGVG